MSLGSPGIPGWGQAPTEMVDTAMLLLSTNSSSANRGAREGTSSSPDPIWVVVGHSEGLDAQTR